jgi:hypothetical protein
MNRLGLKINGIWCVLPQDVSISIEEQNPLFSDSGSFSYPIELSVSQNRELFQSIDSPHGRIRPQDLDGLPFELWYDGMMLLYGSTETDEDLDIEEDKCSINLVSGNGDFKSKIEGMQCTDVPLLDEIYIGDWYSGIKGKGKDKTRPIGWEEFDETFDEPNSMDFKAKNVSLVYPFPYCNIRICVQRNNAWGKPIEQPYYILEADRPWSGMCFYVAYFFDCLFKHLGRVVKKNRMIEIEDMRRLAFITTKCEHRLGPKEDLGPLKSIKAGKYVDISLHNDDATIQVDSVFKYKVYATEKNFPETDVSNLVDSMFNAFGIKIITDTKDGSLRIVMIRDILRDNEVLDEPMIVRDMHVSYSKVRGVRMTYGGDEDDIAYHYKEWDGPIEVFDDYRQVVRRVSKNDKTLFISSITGNKYRIKIDGDAEKEGDEENLNPVLFEVGQFNDYVVGEDVEDAEKLKIGFTPLIENDAMSMIKASLNEDYTQCLALYVDGAAVNKPGLVYRRLVSGYHKFFDDWAINLDQIQQINLAEKGDANPITSYDTGFMLGVMRGAGSDSKTAISIKNYDGNGNDAWVTVEDDYATTADTMDAYGNRYDYNGTTEGGIADQENSISLKPHIQTAKDVGLKNEDGTDADWGIDANAAKRGLADRFMSEYMYFLLHRKTVSMEVDTTLTQLTNLSWFKQLRINDTVGRLKSRSYTLTNNGVTDMNIELYTIN